MNPDETTLYDYRIAVQLRGLDVPIYSLVMAAMMKADHRNGSLLAAAFPEVAAELRARHVAPGGALEGENPNSFLSLRIVRESV